MGNGAIFSAVFFRCGTILILLGAFVSFPRSSNAEDPPPVRVPEPEAFVPEPEGYRTTEYRGRVPNTLRGGKVIGFDEAAILFREGESSFVDVLYYRRKPPGLPKGTLWAPVKRRNIPGSRWLPNVGQGVLSDSLEEYLKKNLEDLTAGDPGRPLVFYCLPNCWLSWNAAKRAVSLGYENVSWFPGGTVEWEAEGMPTELSQPWPMPGETDPDPTK